MGLVLTPTLPRMRVWELVVCVQAGWRQGLRQAVAIPI